MDDRMFEKAVHARNPEDQRGMTRERNNDLHTTKATLTLTIKRSNG